MWKWLQTLLGRSAHEDVLREDVARESRRTRRDGSDAAALLMVPGIGDTRDDSGGRDTDSSGGADSGGGAVDGGGCGASCGAV